MKKPEGKVPASMDDLVRAQNRTTHAVRSLAITFVAAPIISIAIIVAVVVASASGNTAFVIFAGVLGAFIGIATLVVSLDELAKSKVHYLDGPKSTDHRPIGQGNEVIINPNYENWI
jgi:hypothetical protein